MVLAMASVPAFAAGTAHAVDVRCGAIGRTAVYRVEGEAVRCPEARRIATLHARSNARRAACAFRNTLCRVRRYICTYRVGMAPRPKDAFVLCQQPRGPKKIQFRYDARKIRVPARRGRVRPEPAPDPPLPQEPAPAPQEPPAA
ncbi:hypothetical protein [Conexibacter arvalis]|uniref:Uncharacterized protein n=1 Tax=Conexibacter arvalis TaxID=912552 RepID=A0A840IH75_9ACTN|nr:hypothetical protein [Conexibacter arvalis]MBB4663581.1 hypothetical protein [Conexibacter arvalis]